MSQGIYPYTWACENMSDIFETAEASRQKELAPVCTEKPCYNSACKSGLLISDSSDDTTSKTSKKNVYIN